VNRAVAAGVLLLAALAIGGCGQRAPATRLTWTTAVARTATAGEYRLTIAYERTVTGDSASDAVRTGPTSAVVAAGTPFDLVIGGLLTARSDETYAVSGLISGDAGHRTLHLVVTSTVNRDSVVFDSTQDL
jgi:hypothetical protein